MYYHFFFFSQYEESSLLNSACKSHTHVMYIIANGQGIHREFNNEKVSGYMNYWCEIRELFLDSRMVTFIRVFAVCYFPAFPIQLLILHFVLGCSPAFIYGKKVEIMRLYLYKQKTKKLDITLFPRVCMQHAFCFVNKSCFIAQFQF